MFCPKCGSQSSDNTVFCAYCGTRISKREQVANVQSQKHPGEGSAVASLVCGILGFCTVPIILSIIAIVQGDKAKKLGYTGGMATAGTVLGWTGLILGIIGIIFIIIYIIILGILVSNGLLG